MKQQSVPSAPVKTEKIDAGWSSIPNTWAESDFPAKELKEDISGLCVAESNGWSGCSLISLSLVRNTPAALGSSAAIKLFKGRYVEESSEDRKERGATVKPIIGARRRYNNL